MLKEFIRKKRPSTLNSDFLDFQSFQSYPQTSGIEKKFTFSSLLWVGIHNDPLAHCTYFYCNEIL